PSATAGTNLPRQARIVRQTTAAMPQWCTIPSCARQSEAASSVRAAQFLRSIGNRDRRCVDDVLAHAAADLAGFRPGLAQHWLGLFEGVPGNRSDIGPRRREQV